jgi:hypothetical protein
MIHAADLFSTRVRTSRELVKVLYGITYLVTQRLSQGQNFTYPYISLHLFREKEPNLEGYEIVLSSAMQGGRSHEFPFLGDYIRKIVRLFYPVYNVDLLFFVSNTYLDTLDKPLEEVFPDIRVDFFGESLLSLIFSGNDISRQFPSARERLEIPSSVFSILQKIGLPGNDLCHLHSLLELRD